jgi:hypothetical protein
VHNSAKEVLPEKPLNVVYTFVSGMAYVALNCVTPMNGLFWGKEFTFDTIYCDPALTHHFQL